jgi:hypothetical protein
VAAFPPLKREYKYGVPERSPVFAVVNMTEAFAGAVEAVPAAPDVITSGSIVITFGPQFAADGV